MGKLNQNLLLLVSCPCVGVLFIVNLPPVTSVLSFIKLDDFVTVQIIVTFWTNHVTDADFNVIL